MPGIKIINNLFYNARVSKIKTANSSLIKTLKVLIFNKLRRFLFKKLTCDNLVRTNSSLLIKLIK